MIALALPMSGSLAASHPPTVAFSGLKKMLKFSKKISNLQTVNIFSPATQDIKHVSSFLQFDNFLPGFRLTRKVMLNLGKKLSDSR